MKQTLTIVALLFTGVAVWASPSALPSAPQANQNDKENLRFSIEEEKMALNVYTALAAKWGGRPFSNIARAEQKHLDSVMALMTRLGFDVPPIGNAGEFNNPDIQKVYSELMKKGSVSRTEALKVGAMIEDRDIFDLDRIIKETRDSHSKTVYNSLRSGSYNHMRAFVGNLRRSGEEYKPQYISQARFDEIMKKGDREGGTADR